MQRHIYKGDKKANESEKERFSGEQQSKLWEEYTCYDSS
jgi:hypothetical protein